MKDEAGYKIERGVQMPRRLGREPKYPFRSMAIGDSFLVPCKKEENPKVVNNLLGCARNARMNGMKFSTRCVEGGVRCWRVK